MSNARTNGGSTVQPLEMEALHQPGSSATAAAAKPKHVYYLEQLWTLIKLYMEYYPKIATLIMFCLIGLVMSMVIPNLRKPVTRNRLEHDYTTINEHYDFKASLMDHWCLWGGDNRCKCLDFTQPESRSTTKGWLNVHEGNKLTVQEYAGQQLDITFLGDGMVEAMNGTRMGLDFPEGKSIKGLFRKLFTKDLGGEFEGLALGIAGDESANLLWRIQHGELPDSNIYWLWHGVADLTQGYCSEEATVLGILKIAETIALHDKEARVVIQGILPVSRHDGRLQDNERTFSLGHNNKVAHSVSQAKKKYLFWPSIVAINKELESFCKKHDQIIYFDASDLFLGEVGNKHYHQHYKQIVHELMPDYMHPSFQGYNILLNHIKAEMEKLLFDENDKNDIEKKGGGRDIRLRQKS